MLSNLKNYKNYLFGKFQKIPIWKKPKNWNLENYKHLHFGKIQKNLFSKIPNFAFWKIQKFSIWKIPNNTLLIVLYYFSKIYHSIIQKIHLLHLYWKLQGLFIIFIIVRKRETFKKLHVTSKFEKFAICKIAKLSDLKNYKNYLFEKFQEIGIWKIIKISNLNNSK